MDLNQVLEYLKSKTQAGRDSQELDEMEQMRQAGIDARENYESSPAREVAEQRQMQRALAENQEMYMAPQRRAESAERQQNADADKLFYEQEEARKEERYRKLRDSMNKKSPLD